MIKETLYAKYILERQESHILENELGFITYKINGKECFIVDMYVDVNSRAVGKGKSLVYELESIALESSCEFISANIHLWDKGASNTLLSAINVGFEVIQADKNIISIIKKISGGT